MPTYVAEPAPEYDEDGEVITTPESIENDLVKQEREQLQLVEAEIYSYSLHSLYFQLYFYDTSVIARNISEPTTLVGIIDVSELQDVNGR